MRKLFGCLMVIPLLLSFMEEPPVKDRLLRDFAYGVYRIPREKIYLHTDKNVYTVGENVWFRGYLVDAQLHTLNTYSSFVYVDLVSQRDSLISRVKVAQVDSVFQGYLRLPSELPQGEYCLRGYSYYMQNEGDGFLFNKQIRVINPKDSRVKTEISFTEESRNRYVASVRFSDNSGDPFPKQLLGYRNSQTKQEQPSRTLRTNEQGMVDVRVDPTIRFLEFDFMNGDPFPFKRDIYIPRQFNAFDVQFFPEGGALLSGNWQQVAFKAIGENGMGLDVTGELYQDSVLIGDFRTEHDGMGCFRMPVSGGHHFHTIIRLPTGEERRFDLPVPSDTGIGLTVEQNDSLIIYQVIKAEQAVLPKNLHVLVHSRGNIMSVEPAKQLLKGNMHIEYFPEGIAHVLLIDGEGVVYSERLFFVRKKNRPHLLIQPDKSAYSARELVSLNVQLLSFEEEFRKGSFSLSITDDRQVPIDSLEDNILSNLLLTSDLKGYINHPAYYFNSDTPEVNRHLNMVMMTHGWTRFDVSKLVRRESQDRYYPLEIGQVISGKVNNFWGKNAKGANIILLSNQGQFRMVETDKEGNFLIDAITFPDSTSFLVQALSEKGRRSVSVSIDKDEFLPTRYMFPITLGEKEKEERFFATHGRNYYYENGEKIYILDEVIITKRRSKKMRSFYDVTARHHVDSAAIADAKMSDIVMLIQTLLPGVLLERDSEGEEYFSYFNRRLYLLANDFEENMDFVRMLHPDALLGLSLLDEMQARIFFGDRASTGALIISYQFGYVPPRPGRPNIIPFTLLGYQKPAVFYAPKYDVDSVRLDKRYDIRSTIHWEPVVNITSTTGTCVSFYTADSPGNYSVILEGITSAGIICRKRIPIAVK